MANYNNLIAAIEGAIKQNGNNEITGNILQGVLKAVVNSLGAGYQFMGVAIPSTDPGTPDQKVFYFATQEGDYPNFGSIHVDAGELAILKYDSSWSKSNLAVDLGSNYLAKDNTTPYTPTGDYNPATKKYVDDGLSGKVSTVPGKGLSSNDFTTEDKEKLNSAITDAPVDGLLYGRSNRLWQPIALISGLLVTINHPNDVLDGDYTVIVRAAGEEISKTYDGPGMAISVPAGVRVTVFVKAPANFTAPRPFIYDSVLGVTRTYEGTSIAIVDGYYVLTDGGNYVPFDQWTSAYNEHAIGLGYYSSEVSFAVSKVFGRLDNVYGGNRDTTINWGSANFDCSSIGMMQASDVTSARQLPLCGELNSRAMVESHIALQPNWRNETIVNSTTQGYFPIAMVAHKFKTVIDDDYGNWRIPDIKEADIILGMRSKFALIGSVVDSAWGNYGFGLTTCIPVPNNKFWGYAISELRESDGRTSYIMRTYGVPTSVLPVRNF